MPRATTEGVEAESSPTNKGRSSGIVEEISTSNSGKGASQPPSTVALVALCVSVAGFVLAAANLYLTQLREAPITLSLGQEFAVYYPRDGGFGMYVPLNLVNTSGRGGAVLRTRAILSREGDSESYEMEWAGFSQRDSATRDYRFEELQAVSVPQSSAVSKLVWFVWRPDSKPQFTLAPGHYILQVSAWTSNDRAPALQVSRGFSVDDSTAAMLLQRRRTINADNLVLTFDQGQKENVYSDNTTEIETSNDT